MVENRRPVTKPEVEAHHFTFRSVTLSLFSSLSLLERFIEVLVAILGIELLRVPLQNILNATKLLSILPPFQGNITSVME